jgi:hypothetical protein
LAVGNFGTHQEEALDSTVEAIETPDEAIDSAVTKNINDRTIPGPFHAERAFSII